jgi:hypothetical protein
LQLEKARDECKRTVDYTDYVSGTIGFLPAPVKYFALACSGMSPRALSPSVFPNLSPTTTQDRKSRGRQKRGRKRSREGKGAEEGIELDLEPRTNKLNKYSLGRFCRWVWPELDLGVLRLISSVNTR